MGLKSIECNFCGKKTLKDDRHINESKKLNYHHYCSIKCQSESKKRQVTIICQNLSCSKKFSRSLSQVSFRNFCSNKCAMKILGPENGLKHQKFNYCVYCGKRIKFFKKYCSMKCWGKAHELSEEELIAHLLSLSIQLGRTPSRLESNHRSSCIRRFGSWNNALLAAGIKPNRSLNQRMYRRRQCIAKDGHKCDSVSELIIDNWLAMYSIPHSKGYPYPTTGHIADWSLNNLTYVEYFGLARDSKRYDQEIDRKRNLCKESGIKLIEIYSKDLFPKNNLRAIFGEYLDS